MTPLLLTVKRYRKFVERFVEYSMANGSLCLCDAPTVWLSDETAENMAVAKCRLHCVDYNCCGGHLTGILPSFLI